MHANALQHLDASKYETRSASDVRTSESARRGESEAALARLLPPLAHVLGGDGSARAVAALRSSPRSLLYVAHATVVPQKGLSAVCAAHSSF